MKTEIDKMMKSLSGEEVHSLLKQVLLRIDIFETTGYPEKQLITDLLDLKKRISKIHGLRANPRKEYEKQTVRKVHITFDESSGGALRFALRNNLKADGEKVIAFPDKFSRGPVWKLHTKEGLNYRKDWLYYHINLDDKYFDEYEEKFNKIREQIEAIPTHIPITIWFGDNAHEQTGLLFALYLLQQAPNPTFLINATSEYHRTFPGKCIAGYPLSTSEISSDKLAAIYQRTTTEEVDSVKRTDLGNEWNSLSSSRKKLRIWQNGQIDAVPEDLLDDFIIESLRNIHKERGNGDFVKSARLIGEVIGHSTHVVGDGFIEYRVRQLIINGILDLKSVPKAMRCYEVKLRSS